MTARSPDVLVIGGGIIGCSVAYALACRGVRVSVLERDRVGWGAPRAAAGFVWPTMTSRTHDAWFDLCLAASTSYEAYAARLREETGLDPEYRRTGALRVAAGGPERDELRGKGAWMRSAGVEVSWVEIDEARRIEPRLSPELAGALWLPTAAQVAGDRMAQALAHGTVLHGGEVREGVTVLGLEHAAGHVTGVRTGAGVVPAAQVVLAAGAWSGALTAELPHPLPVRPVKGQSLIAETPPGWLRHIVTGTAGSLVPRGEGRLYIGATIENAGFDTQPGLGQVADRINAAESLVPGARSLVFVEARAGLRPASPTYIPIMGPVRGCSGLIAATAHYRNGILLGPLTGEAVAELLLGGHDALELFRRVGAVTADGA